ncbi:threonine aldolase family protein [Chungangia koreensis]|uniref:Threonine aldolase family protein n=1 Tax=Chungangia koreensis TaxID=752657 RepID=A0ABV8XB52_9LACT
MAKSLIEVFKQTTYQVGGNGKRNLKVLLDSLEGVDDSLESDIYGKGQIIEDFQRKMADLLGKESAVFFPSGTMAQQIALRIWCDRKGVNKVAYHPLSHLEIHEEDGLKELHHIETFYLADSHRVIEFDDVLKLNEDVACILLELPQREIGGQLPSFETLEQISNYCRQKGIKLHLDGARLFEVLPFYQKTAAEVCSLFDSVYISFYKGIGGIAGAILAGEDSFTEESKVWKRRHGGDLISLYPYIISSDYYYEKRKDKFEQYYKEATELASLYNSCHDVFTVPQEIVSNMFHVHIKKPKDSVENVLIGVYEESNIGLTGYVKEVNENECSYEVSIGDLYESVPKEDLQKAFELLDEKLKNVN